jgi:hypothetical protein
MHSACFQALCCLADSCHFRALWRLAYSGYFPAFWVSLFRWNRVLFARLARVLAMVAAVRGFVYVLCLDPPRGIGDTDIHCDGPGDRRCVPISHYVGFTRRDWPMDRAGGHGGAGMGSCVLLVRGTVADEERLRTRGRCPRCGGSLNYRAEARRAARAAGR